MSDDTTGALVAKLDELIAATRQAATPASMRWLSAESMAAMLDMTAASVREQRISLLLRQQPRAHECLHSRNRLV